MKSLQQLEEIFIGAQKEAEAFAVRIGFTEGGSLLRRAISTEMGWWEEKYGVDNDIGYCPVLDFVDGPRRVAEKWGVAVRGSDRGVHQTGARARPSHGSPPQGCMNLVNRKRKKYYVTGFFCTVSAMVDGFYRSPNLQRQTKDHL